MKAINRIKEFFGISRKLHDSKEEVDTKLENYISIPPCIGINSTHGHKSGFSNSCISRIQKNQKLQQSNGITTKD